MKKYHAIINITLRKNILDVQGKTVQHALHSIDFLMINNVRIGKLVELDLEAESLDNAKELLNDACNKLIANPIIEDFEINIK